MKKQFLLLAGTAVILASCGSNETKPAGPSQAQIDSTVQAQVAAHDAENKAKNDSTLKAIEAEKAAAVAKEEEAKASAGAHKTKTKTTTTTKTTKTETPPPPPANPKESRFQDANGANKSVDPASTKKKEDRFK